MPLIQLHSSINLSPPLISLASLSSFPPGEAKRRLREPIPFNVPIHSENGGQLGVFFIYKLFAHAIIVE